VLVAVWYQTAINTK